MDIGLDSLGTTELSELLQSQFGIELPSTFVLNNPTIMDMLDTILKLLAPNADGVNSLHSSCSEIVGSSETQAIEPLFSDLSKLSHLSIHGPEAGSHFPKP